MTAMLVASASILMGCTGEPSIDQTRTTEAVGRASAAGEVRDTLELGGAAEDGEALIDLRLTELDELGDLVAEAADDGGKLDAPVVGSAWLATEDPTPNTMAFIDAYRDDPGLEAFGQDRADRYVMGIGVTVALLEPAGAEFEEHFATSLSLDDFEAWLLDTPSVTKTALGTASSRLNTSDG